MSRKRAAPAEILSGWKDIANHLRMGVRTVQRYERELSLPVHRVSVKSKAPVITSKAELNAWITSRSARAELGRKRAIANRTNKIGADFLQIDSQLGLTFSGIALGATSQEKRKRATHTARRAYETIVRLRKKIYLDEAESRNLDANLQRLKSDLRSLGERL